MKRGRNLWIFFAAVGMALCGLFALAACGAEEERPCAHVYRDGPVLREATCTEGGCVRLICTLCGALDERNTPALDHLYGEPQTVRNAECEKDGLSRRTCTRENCEAFTEEIIPATGHSWGEEKIVTPASCTQPGKKEKRCMACPAVSTQIIPASGHSWGEEKVVTPASCTKPGVRSVVCEACGAVESSQEIPATGHSWGKDDVLREATCTDPGNGVRQCLTCLLSESYTIPALGHDLSDPVVDREPTVEREGEMSRHCMRDGCGYRSEIQAIGKLSAETVYSISLCKTTGEALPSGCIPFVSIRDETGAEVKSLVGITVSATLPTKNYTFTVSGLPAGYRTEESYPLPYASPDVTVKIPAGLISDPMPAGTTYRTGSILYDKTLDVIGLTEEQDKMIPLSDLLKQYKAIVLNFYFTTCPACIWEIPYFVQAYYAKSPSGRTYGEEVAFIMLPYGENRTKVRNFKQNPNFYYSGQNVSSRDLPFFMVYSPSWIRCFSDNGYVKAYPTTVIIDCEGVIVTWHEGAMSTNGFINLIEQYGLRRYEAIHGKEETAVSLREPVLIPDERRKFG